jgi:hypothetical protein
MTNANALMVLDEAAAIDAVTLWIEAVEEKMSENYSRQWLEDELVNMLEQGTMAEERIIAEADAGDEIADAALRRVIRGKVNDREEMSVLLSSYNIKALGRAPLTRGRGHYWYDNWRRDLGIVCLVYHTHRRFNLRPSNNREQRRRGEISASSIVAAALWRKGIHIKEKTVGDLWGKLRDHVGRFLLTGQIAA